MACHMGSGECLKRIASYNHDVTGVVINMMKTCLNLNLNSLLVKRQIDNPSPGAVTGGN